MVRATGAKLFYNKQLFSKNSTFFHKRADPFWEQGAGGSNPSATTIIFQSFTRAKVGSELDPLRVAQIL
jgi:hypothetical protein